MTRKLFLLYMTAVFAMTVVAPGRLACGIALALEIFILMIMEVLFSRLIKTLKIERVYRISMLCMNVFFIMLTRQVLILVSPQIALQLGFVLYFPAASAFVTVPELRRNSEPLFSSLKKSAVPALFFSLYTVLFSLLRDIAGYGTISFFTASGLREKVIFPADKISFFSFAATIPGAIILNALIAYAFSLLENKLKILEKAGVIQ
ncbi:MAG: hypothetical protein ACTTKL_02250 [Treponema sp.]